MDDSSRWSFRQRARAWLASVSRDQGDVRSRAFDAAGQRVLLLETARLAAGQTIDGFLLAKGDFACAANCRFGRPIYVAGNCEIGKDSSLDSIEVDGGLHLGPSVRVKRKADSIGPMEIRSGCRIDGIAYSRSAIRLGLHASAKDIYAPKVLTPAGIRTSDRQYAADPLSAVRLDPPGQRLDRPVLRSAGIDPGKLRALTSGAWHYGGSLLLERPIFLAADLAVDGSFSCPPDSLLAGRVNARGSLQLGDGSVARKRLTAGGDMLIRAECVFQGDLVARQMMHLSSGSRGLADGRPVTLRAGGELVLEEDVAIRGRLTSDCRVMARPGETAVARTTHTAANAG